MLRPNTLAMTAVLAMLTALGPLATDFYLPSLPDIVRVLDTTTSGAQATLSAFLFGFAAGQVIWGPLSDRLGRKPVLYIGLSLFIVATVACAASPDIGSLIGARVLQALGASGPIVLGRAMVRDLYDGPRAGQELSRMGMIMGVVPAIAPVLGAGLHEAFGWRSTFVASLVFAIGILIIVLTIMPETLREKVREPLSIGSIFRGYATILENRAYRVYAGLTALAYAGLFAFISGSSFVLVNIYGLSPRGFALSFAFGVLGFISGTILAQKLVLKRGLDGVIGIGVVCLALGGATMLLLVLLGTGSSLEITLPMALYTVGVGMVMPQAQASAMMPFGARAGAASSLTGLCQMLLSACVGLLVGWLLKGSALPMPMLIALIGAAALALFHAGRKARTGAA